MMLDIIYYSRMMRVDSGRTKRFVVRSEFGYVPRFSAVSAGGGVSIAFVGYTII